MHLAAILWVTGDQFGRGCPKSFAYVLRTATLSGGKHLEQLVVCFWLKGK
jgi:hypothetical protein